MNLSEIVKKYRTEHDLSQRQFSAMCNMSTGYISMLEEGVNPRTKEPLVPSLVTLRKIAIAMGMNLDDLMSMIDGDSLVSINSQHIAMPIPPIEQSSDRDRVHEISESLQRNPKLGLLFDRSRKMSERDLDAVLGIVDAILKERDS